MRRVAANVYRPNAELVRLHQRIAELRQGGLLQSEIAEKVYMSLTAVRYHLRGNCNCKNGSRDELAAGEVREVAVGAQDRGPAPLRPPVRGMQRAGEAGGLE
jgi:orotate phosphoribosyltransferase-like protein